MTIEFKLPDIGEGVAEGEIVRWLVNAGDAVSEHQPIVEVMTDKATVEIPSPADGVVSQLIADAGEVVPVGSVIFNLEAGGGAAPAEAAPVAAPAPSPAAASEVLEFQLPTLARASLKVRSSVGSLRKARPSKSMSLSSRS